MSQLPPDMIRTICTWLDVRSILRSAQICKWWLSAIEKVPHGRLIKLYAAEHLPKIIYCKIDPYHYIRFMKHKIVMIAGLPQGVQRSVAHYQYDTRSNVKIWKKVGNRNYFYGNTFRCKNIKNHRPKAITMFYDCYKCIRVSRFGKWR